MGKPKFSSTPTRHTQILVGGRVPLEARAASPQPTEPSSTTKLKPDELQTSDGAVLRRLPSKRDQAGYIRHPAAAAAHRVSSAAVQLQQERVDVLFRKSCSEQQISNRSDVAPHRAHTTSPMGFNSPDGVEDLVMNMEKYRLVPPLSAPASQNADEQGPVARRFQTLHDSYDTSTSIVPDDRSGPFEISTEFHQNQRVKMLQMRQTKHGTKRSDVHKLACVLDETLRWIWGDEGQGSAQQFRKAKEAIEIAMGEVANQVSVSCVDLGMLLREMFAQHSGLQDLSLERMDELELLRDELLAQIWKLELQIGAMDSDKRLFVREIQIYDDAIHAMIADVIGLQKEITSLERKKDEQDQEYSVLRQSHIATIEEIGQFKIKLELKEKSRQQVIQENKELQALLARQQEEIETMTDTINDAKQITRDCQETLKINAEEATIVQAELESTIAELMEEINGFKLKEGSFEDQIHAVRKKLAKSEKQLSIEKQKKKGSGKQSKDNTSPQSSPVGAAKADKSDSDSSSDDDDDGDQQLVDIALLVETQSEVAQLQVSLVQTQEQVERSVMELERAITAYEHSEFKVAQCQRDTIEYEKVIAMLQVHVTKMEQAGENMLGRNSDGFAAVSEASSKVVETQQQAEALLQRAAEMAAELKVERKEAEDAMKAATTDAQKKDAAQAMSKVAKKEAHARRAKEEASQKHAAAQSMADNEAIMARERATQHAAKARLAASSQDAKDAVARAQQLTATATTDEEKRVATEEMRKATEMQENIAKEHEKMQDIHRNLALDAKVRKAKAENEIKALKNKAKEAMENATTEDEKLAARRLTHTIELAETRAKLADARIKELEDEKKKPVQGGNSFWQWQGLRSMPLIQPGVSIQEVSKTIMARMNLLGGLSDEEQRLVDTSMAQSKLSRVGLDESISPKDPASGTPKLRRRLAAMQANVITMLRATKTASGLEAEANEDVRKRLLYTPPAGSLASSRPVTRDPFGHLLDASGVDESAMLRELIGENDRLKNQLAEMARMNQKLMLEHTQMLAEVQMFRDEATKRQNILLNAKIPPEAANWPQDAIDMLLQMQAEMSLLANQVGMLQKQLDEAREQGSGASIDMDMMLGLSGSAPTIAGSNHTGSGDRPPQGSGQHNGSGKQGGAPDDKYRRGSTDERDYNQQGDDADRETGGRRNSQETVQTAQLQSKDGTDETCKDLPPIKSGDGQSRAAEALVNSIKNKRKQAAAEKERKARAAEPNKGKKGNKKRNQKHERGKQQQDHRPSIGASSAASYRTEEPEDGYSRTSSTLCPPRCECLLCLLGQWIEAEPTEVANCMEPGLDWALSCSVCGGMDGITDALAALLQGPLFTLGAKLGAQSMDNAIYITNNLVQEPENRLTTPPIPNQVQQQETDHPIENRPVAPIPLNTDSQVNTEPSEPQTICDQNTTPDPKPQDQRAAVAESDEPQTQEDKVMLANKTYGTEQPDFSASRTHHHASNNSPITVPERKKLQVRTKYEGSWMPHEAKADEREPPQVPVFGKEPNIKRIHKTLQFCCVAKDGHSTHCFFYNEKEGLRGGGICQCMFSTERVNMPAEVQKQAQIPSVETEQQRRKNTETLPEAKFVPECPSPTPLRPPSVFHGSPQAVPTSPPLSKTSAVVLRRFDRSQSPIF